MPALDDEIRARTATFAERLAGLLRQATLEGAAAALSAGTGASERGRGQPKRTTTLAPAGRAVPPPAKAGRASRGVPPRGGSPAAPKRAPGQKRSPAELAALTEQLDHYIKTHPGRRMETIAKGLGATAAELRFPATKLIRAKKVRTEGQKQSTAYFPV